MVVTLNTLYPDQSHIQHSIQTDKKASDRLHWSHQFSYQSICHLRSLYVQETWSLIHPAQSKVKAHTHCHICCSFIIGLSQSKLILSLIPLWGAKVSCGSFVGTCEMWPSIFSSYNAVLMWWLVYIGQQ